MLANRLDSGNMLITFWDFSMVEQIFLSPQIKRGVIISNTLVYSSNELKTIDLRKLTPTTTTTIPTHTWKTRNKPQFDNTIIPATNAITNIKNEPKNIILTHYKHHTINSTPHEFQSNFCINSALCKLTQNSITMPL